METQQIQTEDESGDKDYFVMVPNYILNHSTAITQAIYLQMKRRAGEKGLFWESQKSICKRLGIGRKSWKKSVDYMLDHQWITDRGLKQVKTKGGEHSVKVYSVNDIWKMNTEYYAKGGAERAPLGKGGAERASQGGAERAPKNNPLNQEEPKVITNVITGLTPRDKRLPEIQQLQTYGDTLGFRRGKKQRYAIHRLLKQHTAPELMEAAKISQGIKKEAFAPQVSDWFELEQKFHKLRDFFERAKNPQKKGKIWEPN